MNMKRMRGRNHRPNGGGGGGGGGFRNQQNGIPLNRNHVFDSSGPEMRVRGTAQQLFEKYQQLARDASSNGDRVLGEAYYQHAEHYFRIISAINQAQGQPNQPNGQPNPNGGQPYQNNNGQDRGNYQNGPQNGDYNRRTEPNAGDVSTEPQTEARGETRHEARYEPRNQEQRGQQEPRRYENRPYENRDNRNKPDYQPRQDRDQRPDQRTDQRPDQRPDHRSDQRPERQDREQRFRPETVISDARIDISSALEAELAAATAGLAEAEPAGFGAQPALPEPAIEARAIPIIPDAPPPVKTAAPAEATPAEPAPTEPAPARKPRGRPRAIKPEAAELKLETPDSE
jgi:hypothetical protein